MEKLFTIKDGIPADYHCDCHYCQKFGGVILDPNGVKFSGRKRVGYLREKSDSNNNHIAKTPFGIALWATEEFTDPGDWILDPTMGVGTSGVEAKKQGRFPIGIELNRLWGRVAAANFQQHEGEHKLFIGDAKNWKNILEGIPKVKMIINNPPYSGDANVSIKTDEFGEIIDRTSHDYDNTDKENLAFLKENAKYYEEFGKIYNGLGAEHLLPGGFLVIGVKDMVRNKAPYMLHQKLCDVVDTDIYDFHGTWLLPHYPRTLFMNTYPKWYPGVKVPFYQTISVFKKKLIVSREIELGL